MKENSRTAYEPAPHVLKQRASQLETAQIASADCGRMTEVIVDE